MPEEIKRAFLRDSMTLKAFLDRVVVVHERGHDSCSSDGVIEHGKADEQQTSSSDLTPAQLQQIA